MEERQTATSTISKDQAQQKQQKLKMNMKFREVPKRNHDGFRLIKEKIAQSNSRTCGVKFGMPFETICEAEKIEKVAIQEVIVEVPRTGIFGSSFS